MDRCDVERKEKELSRAFFFLFSSRPLFCYIGAPKVFLKLLPTNRAPYRTSPFADLFYEAELLRQLLLLLLL